MMGKWLSNMPDPHQVGAQRRAQHNDEERRNYMKWINRNVIGEPKAMPKFTVKQLMDEGYIGLYKPDPPDEGG